MAADPTSLSADESRRVGIHRGHEQARDADQARRQAFVTQRAQRRDMQDEGFSPMQSFALSGQGGQGGNSRLLMSLMLGPDGAAQFEAIDAQAKALQSEITQRNTAGERAERMGNRQLAVQMYQSAQELGGQLAGVKAQLQQSNNALQAALAQTNAQTAMGQQRMQADERIAGLQNTGENTRAAMGLFGNMMQSTQANALKEKELGIQEKQVGFQDPAKQVAAAKAMLPFDPQTPPDVRLNAAITSTNQGGQLPPQLAMALDDYYRVGFDESWIPGYGGSDEQFIASAARRFGLSPQVVRQWLGGQ
jgi:hypothetical protein